jgi:hypothetical protein
MKLGLLRLKGAKESLQSLKKALENGDDIPTGTDVHTVAQCLFQLLYSLPRK